MLNENEKFLVIDTETTNDIDDPIVYDVGFSVIDIFGNIYEEHSYVVAETFIEEKELMKTAYFADKIPMYQADIKQGKRTLKRYWNIKQILFETIKKYNIKIVMAHNMRFDYRSLNLTLRWFTSSKYRYFLPYGIEIWDTLKMARETFKNDNDYKEFCLANNFVTKRGANKYTAEVLYRYLTKNLDFVESHTGLEDTLIEKEIFVECMKRNNELCGRLWG